MRKSMLAATAAALLAAVSIANAAEIVGTIKTIDTTGGMITLDNGKVYKLPTTFKAADWKVGEKVKVLFENKNGQLMVTTISKG